MASAAADLKFPDWPASFDNTLLQDLRADTFGDPYQSREVLGAHYTRLRPNVKTPTPVLVAHSEEVAAMCGMSKADVASEAFLKMFSGSPPAAHECWATAYGASFAGSYGGQRGDGRAISLGQTNELELQLKGGGTTPFSRQFDGRAVLRSCVREFLASEAMAALRVPTTRCLCVVATGDGVVRQWYGEDGRERVLNEPGAVGTRVARSYLRFGQLELFTQRGELPLLQELAEHALTREFGHLLLQHPDEPRTLAYARMFKEVCERQALLMAEWLRVGYCQGNMNSDNSALGGVTLDYGPFAFMERFVPMYNPWVGGGPQYAFGRQPQAAAVNLAGLAPSFIELVQLAGTKEGLSKAERDAAVDEIRDAVQMGYVDSFHAKHDDNCRAKLGLSAWDDEAQQLWDTLFTLMASRCGGGGVDFTIFFRSLGDAEPAEAELVRGALAQAALQPTAQWPADHVAEWTAWAERYTARLAKEARPAAERRAEMNLANPKYILRNWMAAEAYEAAERGDFGPVREVHKLLCNPYEEQAGSVDERWAQPTPQWARERPGVAFMS